MTTPLLRSPRLDATASSSTRRRLLSRDPLTIWLGIIAAILTLILVILPEVISTSPNALDPGAPLSPPSSDHLFGTDQVGRDVAVRILHGARLSLLIATASALIALIAGTILGMIAATSPRAVGEFVMRAIDIGLAFPELLLAIVLAAAIGPHLATTIFVLGAIYTFPMARVVRAAVFSEYGEDYVTAARLSGMRARQIVSRHISRNVALPVLVYTTVIMSQAVVAEAALSFVGAGIKPPAPSWGNIIRDGYAIVHSGAWWVSLFPGIALVFTVLSINRLSEAMGRRARLT